MIQSLLGFDSVGRSRDLLWGVLDDQQSCTKSGCLEAQV